MYCNLCVFFHYSKKKGDQTTHLIPWAYLPFLLVYEKILHSFEHYSFSVIFDTKLQAIWVNIAKGMLKIVK